MGGSFLGGEFSCWRPCMSHKNHSCSSLALLVTRGPSFPSPLKEMAPGKKIWRSPGQGYSNLQTFKPTSKPTFKPSFKLSNKLSNFETSFEINLQTFKETFKLSNKFSNQPSIFETNFQTFKPTFKPTLKFSNKLPNQTVEPTFKPTFNIPNKLSNCQTNFQTNLQTFKQTSKLSNKFSNQHSNFQTNWELQVAPRLHGDPRWLSSKPPYLEACLWCFLWRPVHEQPISFRDSVRWLSVSHHARDTKKALVSLFTPAPATQLK